MSTFRIVSLILQTINELLLIFSLVNVLILESGKFAIVPGIWWQEYDRFPLVNTVVFPTGNISSEYLLFCELGLKWNMKTILNYLKV